MEICPITKEECVFNCGEECRIQSGIKRAKIAAQFAMSKDALMYVAPMVDLPVTERMKLEEIITSEASKCLE